MKTTETSQHEAISRAIRGRIVEISHKTGVPHLASSLSCVDILVASYWAVMNTDPGKPESSKRDRFILSKGHAASALFTVLSARGFFEDALLEKIAEIGSPLEEHPAYNCVPGVEASTGSLGHGLSLGAGMALAGRIQKNNYRVFVLLGDGECNEGSVWEAAMFASANRLDNVAAIVDFNKWQATGRSCEIMAIEPFKEKWEAFGWSAYETDGHNMSGLVKILSKLPDGTGKPVAVIANTVKGKGISFMEDDNNWHYRIPTEDEVLLAKKELGLT